jgi:release factor glutamine methyltransferase
MAEFHRLPSLQSESSNYCYRFDPTTTTTHNDDDDDNNDDNNYEKEIVQHWDAWNDAATQLAVVQSSSASSDGVSTTATATTATVPSLDHLTYRDYESVYEPSDDTYLLMDALQYELQKQIVVAADQTPICLEIGCGTGVVSAFFRQYWMTHMISSPNTVCPPPYDTDDDAAATLTAAAVTSGPSLLSYVTDINPIALRVTQRTFQQLQISPLPPLPLPLPTTLCQSPRPHGNHQPPLLQQQQQRQQVECIQCDLATPLLRQLQHQVDFIIFNPPYVPTANEEIGVGHHHHHHHPDGGGHDHTSSSSSTSSSSDVLRASYAGGTNGRMVIDRALPQIVQLLRRRRPCRRRCHPLLKDDHAEDGSILDTTTVAAAAAAAYMVTVDDNLPLDMAIQMDRLSQHQLCLRPLFRKRVRNEFLTIQKITWRDNDDDDY